MKSIRIQTTSPIAIDAVDFISTVNELRKEHGEKKKDKAPIELVKALQTMNLFQNRDAEKGMISFNISYEDDNQIPCVRNFPNFGLDVKSESKFEQIDSKLLLSVDVTVKAGKPKWQIEEISALKKIFEIGNFQISLTLTLDETTDWGGYSSHIKTCHDTPESLGAGSIPVSFFKIEVA